MLIHKIWIAPLVSRKDYWNNLWVKWEHHMDGILHCIDCLQLDGCYFTFINAPAWPHHDNCHCTLEAIDFAVVQRNARATSSYLKFCPYLFNTNGAYSHRKEKLFAEWGYTADDAKWLQAEMERQAREKYVAGDYRLGKLNIFGQRIDIIIEIPRKTGLGTVSFTSGWMVEANGKLTLNTPYGGK